MAAFFTPKLISTLVMLSALSSTAWAAEPGTLTSLGAIHALSSAEADRGIPVAFEATVVYSRGYDNLLFVQDGDAALFVRPPKVTNLVPGDRVVIEGKTLKSFRTLVVASAVTFSRHGDLPKPVPATFDELIRGLDDCRRVTVQAKVRAADMVISPASSSRSARLQLLMDGGHIEASVDSGDESALKDMLDAEVEITGVASGKFDDKMQQTGIILYASKLADVRVLKPASTTFWSLPFTPMDQILSGYHVQDSTRRVQVHGTITYYQPGSAVVLEDGSKSLWISTHTREPLRIGDYADASGFPEAHDRFLTLTDGEIYDSHIPAPVMPLPATWRQLGFWNRNSPDGHVNDLVAIYGQVVTEVRESTEDEYVLVSDGRLFTAIYRHPGTTSALPPMRQIPLGSKVRVTGICTILDTNEITPGDEVPFNILLRSFDDIALISNPSVLSTRNLLLIVAVLFAGLVAAASKGWALARKVRRQRASMTARVEAEAALERRRSSILEDINGSMPLAEIIERITELVSLTLDGAPCWCQITDGALLGTRPPEGNDLRIVDAAIPGRSGSTLGVISVGLDPLCPPDSDEADTLAVGTRLAKLAIDTRKLYSDLQYRSEYDLLTEIHNRFSLDRYLDMQIEEADQQAGIFGLIYIDLDDFKQVNDRYGHMVGDMYLREVALRMKKQLRSHDMLARLGGDEFAVLVPMIRSREEVVEIAQRLERSFDDPFAIEGFELHGSASVGIALYPEDGATRDGLLGAADVSMYVAKHTKQPFNRLPPEPRTLAMTPKDRAY